MRKEYIINIDDLSSKEAEEIRNYIRTAKRNDSIRTLLKNMKEALKQLKSYCSEEQCNEWEELIKKIEVKASNIMSS